jgi:gluconate kinase
LLIILFGLCGSGKNYVGQILRDYSGFHYVDADDLLPPFMVEIIKNKQHLTKAMIDEYVQSIIEYISKLAASGYDNIVICQALYKEANRQQILRAYPSAILIQIEADNKIISQRISKRMDLADLEYAQKILPFFEYTPGYKNINNSYDGKESIIKQLKLILRV